MNLGIERLMQDLRDLNYTSVQQVAAAGMPYAVIPDFQIAAGAFDGRIIGLAIPCSNDYPRSGPASMHIKASPVLYAVTIPGKVNIQASPLGGEWQYWSFRFILSPQNPTTELVAKINEIFRKC
jgi:hypothetical protein